MFTAVWDGMKEIWTPIRPGIIEKLNGCRQSLRFPFGENRKPLLEMAEGGSWETKKSLCRRLANVPYNGYIAELPKTKEF